ncbi:HEAT repeat domain-containing protein [Laspinema olomoucense]|uniref:HEAT repeat domain-containing protein n=1 Tax=Laspinema olomoucense TaxID=3231600 RepID=UPI0021BB0EAB|nr:HEAT repeat domain-containing protein [Laspinema sp. D3d]MCT7975135.1 HEAT repeat domain-containing protein [Laspinema sp. D3d]
MLNRRLSSNLLTANEDINFNLDDIHVPLALVERRQRDKRPGETRAEEGSQLYEPTGYEEKQRFEHDQFLQDILGKGEGKTKGRQIAIIGEPGAGKTTLLQKIAFWILEERSDLPIWISLADLQGRELGDYLLETWLKQVIPSSRLSEQVREDFLAQLEQGRVWLLLDGVDEMATERATGGLPLQQIATQLKGWIASARVVLTCRVNVWEANLNALEAFETYRMLNFKYPTQVEAFIGKWFERSDATKGEALRQELAKAEYQRLQDLVKNPLRLTLLCSTWQTSEGLPETQAALYQRFVGKIYQWKQNYFPTTEQQRQQLNHALGELARRGIDDVASAFRLRQQLVTEVLGDRDDDNSLFALALQLGWLNQVGVAAEDDTEKVYAFYHATFQEYFGALSIEDWDFFLPENHIDCPVPDKRYRIFDPLWKQTILLWLGRKDVPRERKEEFINQLVEFEDGCGEWENRDRCDRGFYEYRAYFFAAAGITEFKKCDQADEIIAQIVQWVFGYFIEEEQEWQTFLDLIASNARTVLGETERTKAIAGLVKLIAHSESGYTRWQAAYSLGAIDPGNPEAIPGRFKLIAHSESEYTRRQAASSLEAIDPGNPEAIAGLVNLIAYSESEEICREAASTLEAIGAGNPEVIAGLVNLIAYSRFESTRREAASTLEAIGAGNPEAIAVLVNLIAYSRFESTRRQAASTLEAIGAGNPEAIARLVNLIAHSQSEETRRQAASSLGAIDPGNPEAISELVNLIAHSQSEETRRQAASSLEAIGAGNPEAIARLVNLIAHSQSEETRRQAASSLGAIDPGNPEAIAGLVNLIAHSEYKFTRTQAASSLTNILTTEEQMSLVVSALKDCLSTETDKNENDFDRYEESFQVIWHCAQNLPYPEFYRAWHGEEDEVEPEPVSNLPQCLHAKLEEMGLSSSLQLICIDGSKFIDKDNPAAKIYNEMRRANCPKRADGTPKTMADLQSYWDELTLESEQAIVLVFYETLTAPEMSGFSEKFLTDLSKFDGAICVVTEARVSGLQTFSPNQGNWLAELVNWIQN